MSWLDVEIFFEPILEGLGKFFRRPLVYIGFSALFQIGLLWYALAAKYPLAIIMVFWVEFFFVLGSMLLKLEHFDYWVTYNKGADEILKKVWLGIHFFGVLIGVLLLYSWWFYKACRADGVCAYDSGMFAFFGYFSWPLVGLMGIALLYHLFRHLVFRNIWYEVEAAKKWARDHSVLSTYLVHLHTAFTMVPAFIALLVQIFVENLNISMAVFIVLKAAAEIYFSRFHFVQRVFAENLNRIYQVKGKSIEINQRTEALLTGIEEQLLDASYKLANLFSIRDVNTSVAMQAGLVGNIYGCLKGIRSRAVQLPVYLKENHPELFLENGQLRLTHGYIKIAEGLAELTESTTDWQRNYLSVLAKSRIRKRIGELNAALKDESKAKLEPQVRLLYKLLPEAERARTPGRPAVIKQRKRNQKLKSKAQKRAK